MSFLKANSVSSLSLSGCEFTWALLEPIVNKLLETGNLQSLDVSRNPLGEEGSEKLAQSLSSFPVLTELNVNSTGMAGKGFRVLMQFLVQSSIHLESLNIGGTFKISETLNFCSLNLTRRQQSVGA